MNNTNWIGLYTLIKKEMTRFLRIWSQTLLPPVITMTLYFIIFGHVLGSRVGQMHDIPYMTYIVPGLVMMSIITNAYSNVSSSFFGLKFSHSIDELTVSPLSPHTILWGFILGGTLRGLLVGLLVTIDARCFTSFPLQHGLLCLTVAILSALLFSLAGFLNGLFAKKFDDISIIPTFVLTPLTYLGGVFYSVNLLPSFWHHISLFNPVLYMVSAFRFSLLGFSEVNHYLALGFVALCVIILYSLNYRLLAQGYGIRQ